MSWNRILVDPKDLADKMETYFVQRTRMESGYSFLDHMYDLGGIHILEMLHLLPEGFCTELRKICEMGFTACHPEENTEDYEMEDTTNAQL